MNHIKLLDKETASKIAAGEVIERPAAVLKELLENSLDAGATVINIDIEKAGKKLIRVNDNGSGIPSEDLPNAILRHTTSKINNFEDLNTLNTFGFRGEALYSVSAISKLTIASYNTGDNGAKIMVEGGAVKGQSIAPKIPGTTVEVRDLFFNTPARLKFLKSDAVERAHLLRTAEEAALANPQTAFNIKTDGTKVYSLPAAKPDEKGLRNRI
ncbi:MAG: DNA mismatch repair endonuclease MutL, partial [Elusimicrobiota bacterium]|nr:DNA mismatch repair endonuclease MutL [Elusimicrobiota bacterium]